MGWTLRHAVRLGLLIWALCLAAPGHAAPGIRWAKSFEGALAEAKKSNRPVMVDFYTDWCGWCKVLDRETLSDRKVIECSQKFVAVKVNAEREGVKAAQRYGVDSFPRILFLEPSGSVMRDVQGFKPAAEFLQDMDRVVRAHEEYPLLQSQVRKNPADLEAAGKLVRAYVLRGRRTEAVALLARAEKLDPSNRGGHLTKAYNAVGYAYQAVQQHDRAISTFRKAVDTGKEPGDIAYGRLLIAACYLAQKKTVDAKRELEAIVRMAAAPEEYRQRASMTLQAIGSQ